MTDITPFDFKGHAVRVITIDGEPWWVAADVCAALTIADVRRAVDRLRSHDRRLTPVVDSAGRRNPNTWAINESGLYRLVLRSDKPEADAFQDWVTAEVLPQIRKTGSYAVAPAQPRDSLDVAQDIIDAIRADRQRLAALETQVREVRAIASAAAGEHDEFTALAYAKLNDLPTDRTSCQRHGQRASRLMRAEGLAPRKRQDATFGSVNVYPVRFLEDSAE